MGKIDLFEGLGFHIKKSPERFTLTKKHSKVFLLSPDEIDLNNLGKTGITITQYPRPSNISPLDITRKTFDGTYLDGNTNILRESSTETKEYIIAEIEFEASIPGQAIKSRYLVTNIFGDSSFISVTGIASDGEIEKISEAHQQIVSNVEFR